MLQNREAIIVWKHQNGRGKNKIWSWESGLGREKRGKETQGQIQGELFAILTEVVKFGTDALNF